VLKKMTWRLDPFKEPDPVKAARNSPGAKMKPAMDEDVGIDC